MRRKSPITLLIILLVGILLLAACGKKEGTKTEDGNNNGSKKEVINLTIGGGSGGGTWNLIASALADHLESELGNVRVTVSEAGGVENLLGIESEQYDLGFSYASSGAEALEGSGPFEQPLENLEAIAGFYQSPWTLVASSKSDIHKVEDLKGTRFSAGEKGFTGEAISEMVLDLYGIGFDDLKKVEYVDFNTSVSLISDGHLDAFNVFAAVPSPPIQELANGVGARLLSLDDEKIKEIQENNPGFSEYIIKANAYKGQDEDIKTIGTNNVLYVNKNLPEDLIYDITRIMYEKKEQLASVHVLMEEWDIEDATENIAAPLHPGAEKFYNESK